MISFSDFEKLDIRVGKIIAAENLPNAQHTTHKLTIDFGPEIGTKVSGARLVRYTHEELLGKRVLAVVNLPQKQIGSLKSEVLTLGVPDGKGECRLIVPDKEVPLGGKLY